MAAAVVAALIAAAAPAVGAAPRSADRPAVADPAGGRAAVLSPWQAVERWLRNLTGADSSEGGGGTGSGGENPGDPQQEPPPPPPTCPSGQSGGPCTDPSG